MTSHWRRAPAAASLLCALLAFGTVWSVDGWAQQTGIFRLVTFDTGGGPRLGATEGDGDADVVDVHNAVRVLLATGAPEAKNLPYIPADMRSLVEAGPASLSAVKTVYRLAIGLRASGNLMDPGGAARIFYPPTAVKLRAPILNPSKMFGLAGNYPREGALASPKFPSAFFKSVAALVGQGDVIDLAGLVTTGVHEPELSFVIGKLAKNVPESQAYDYVAGYMICNDVSARDLPQGQHPSQGSTMSKGLDTFSPCGPYFTLKEDVPDPHNLAIQARLNGEPWDIPNAHTRP